MKSTELRIGNYLQDAKEKLAPVEGLSKNKIKAYSGIVTEMPLKPIPLTEEWLLKFHPNALDLSNSIFRIGRFKLIWKFSYQYWYVIDDMTGAYITKIEFVHEWQNFWHIMNGEELTLKQTESI